MSNAQPIISLSHVTLRFESGLQALDDVTFDLAPAEHVCVLGSNGSGKSTLASVICGLLAPDEGSVTLVGEHVFDEGELDLEGYRRARRSLGLVFQNPDEQIVTSIVEDDVAFGPENLGLPQPEIERRVRASLHHVAMQDYAQADPSRLSGGQKQRVAIAGAIALKPRVLVFDEPGALLDVRGRRAIVQAMDRITAAGCAVVHITHFMEEAFAADRVIVLHHGRIALEGTPEEVFSHGEELSALGLEEPFPARLSEELRSQGVGVGWTCREDVLFQEILNRAGHPDASGSDAAQVDAAEEASSGQRLATGPSATPAPAETLIEVDHLSYSYGAHGRRGVAHRRALDDVSFQVRRGDLLSLIGQTGSGKSTLLRLICALESPDSGSISICGIDTCDKKRRRELRDHIGYVMQHPERQLFAETVAQDVAFGPTNEGLPAEEVAARVDRALEEVGLQDKRDASPFELSGGQQRAAALAGVLAMRPEIIMLDEPTAGLDPRGRARLRRILTRINEEGVTIVQVTHSMEDAAASGRVIVLDNSKLLFDGRPDEVFCRAKAQRLRACGLGLPEPLEWALRLEDQGLAGLGEPLEIDDLAHAIREEVR